MPGQGEPRAEVFFDAGSLPWIAAALAFALLVLAEPAADIWSGRRRDGLARFMRAGLFLMVAALGVVPPLAAREAGMGLFFHAVLFPVFCYQLGKRIGWGAGRRHLEELLGIESRDGLEETQDRLFESGMRFPSRAEVVKSITDLAKAGKEANPAAKRETANGTRPKAKTKTIDLSDKT